MVDIFSICAYNGIMSNSVPTSANNPFERKCACGQRAFFPLIRNATHCRKCWSALAPDHQQKVLKDESEPERKRWFAAARLTLERASFEAAQQRVLRKTGFDAFHEDTSHAKE